MWNFLTRAGLTLAQLPFIKGLNAPEVYADRIRRDFRLRDYADAWNLYASDPAYWKRYYDPPRNDSEWKDALVRDSAAHRGVPSRRNVFEYEYPGSASGTPQAEHKRLPQAPDYADSLNDRLGKLAAPVPAPGAPSEPTAGSSKAVRPEEVRVLTRKDALGSPGAFDSGSSPVPYLSSLEFNDRLGNWTVPPNNVRRLPQASRPLGVFAGEPNYTIPPPIWGLEDQGSAQRNDAGEWSLSWIKPLLRQ